MVDSCARHLQNPARKCDLPIGNSIPLTNREFAFSFTYIYGELSAILLFRVCWISSGQETSCFCKLHGKNVQRITHLLQMLYN
jgi:hypothetical protein